MDIDTVFHLSREVTVQCAQIGEHNVWVRVCWLAGQYEGKYSVQNRTFRTAKCLSDIQKKKIFIDEKLKFNKENFK